MDLPCDTEGRPPGSDFSWERRLRQNHNFILIFKFTNFMEGKMNLDEQFATHFVCAKCQNTGAVVKRIAATGTGLSKFFDIQHNHFVAVSCSNCGYTELYNPEVYEGKRNLGSVLDILFGS